jgi:hypothetical protein
MLYECLATGSRQTYSDRTGRRRTPNDDATSTSSIKAWLQDNRIDN